jgi:hypothetical protein
MKGRMDGIWPRARCGLGNYRIKDLVRSNSSSVKGFESVSPASDNYFSRTYLLISEPPFLNL